MNRLNVQETQPNPAGGAAVPRIKFDRTGFDYIILVASYVMMPIGLILALLRLMLTHYKNYRKPTNLNLLMHVFLGGFVGLAFLMFLSTIDGATTGSEMLSVLIVFAIIFLVPALILSRVTAKAKYTLSKFNTLYIDLIQNKNLRHIGSISDRIGQSESDVRRDVQYLKDKGLLDIEVVLIEGRQMSDPSMQAGNFGQPRRATGFGGAETAQTPPLLPKSVRCSGCGAQNTVQPNQSTSCEYCGTTISYS